MTGVQTCALPISPPGTTTAYVLTNGEGGNVPGKTPPPPVPAAGNAPPGPPATHWAEKRTGFKYRDLGATNAGVRYILLKEGVDGKARIVVSAKGENIDAAPLPLALDTTVTVQMRNGAACWEGQFSRALRNDDKRFKAKVD